MVLPLFTQHMHPDYRKYLLARGLQEDKEQGCILIPHTCQHLIIHQASHDLPDELAIYTCAIHNSPERPAVCGKYHGQKMVKGARFYVPPGCSYREG
jgi:hypothetical protein